jgi:transposase
MKLSARSINNGSRSREIARHLSLSRNTVRKFLQAEATPPRSRPPYRGSILDPYKPYILERWKSGCWNGAQLLEEIKKLGYSGSDALFRYFMTQVRKQHQARGNRSGPRTFHSPGLDQRP